MKRMLVLAVVLSSAQVCAWSPVKTIGDMVFGKAPVAVAAPVPVAPKAAGMVTRSWNQIVRPFKAVGGYASSAKTSIASAARSAKATVVSAAGSVATSVNTHRKTTAAVTAVVAVAGIATLYYTNEAFRNKVRELLGLDKAEVKNA